MVGTRPMCPYAFQHVQVSCEPETKRFSVCRSTASAKPFGNVFAGALQALNRLGMCLQEHCKRQTVKECIYRNAASVKLLMDVFAGTLQAFGKSGITLCDRQLY